jgi:hypothetical protein
MKMYQEAGDDTAARKVAINQRKDQRKLGNLKWYRKLFNWLLYITIGYGYRTWDNAMGFRADSAASGSRV